MLTFSRFVNEVAEPLSKGDRDFKKNHEFVKNTKLADKSTDDDKLFNASNVTKTKRHADRESNDHDKKEYEKFNGGVSEDVINDLNLSEGTIKTDSGTAKITDSHVHFNNSGYKQKFSHDEIHKIVNGGSVRGFEKEKNQGRASKDVHVISNGDEDHYLPHDWKKHIPTKVNEDSEVVDPNSMATDATEFSDPKPEIADAASKMPEEELKKVLKTEEKKYKSMSSTIRNVLGK